MANEVLIVKIKDTRQQNSKELQPCHIYTKKNTISSISTQLTAFLTPRFNVPWHLLHTTYSIYLCIHYWLNGHESEWTLGVCDGQGGLACCNSWGHKELDMTEQLKWIELNWTKCSVRVGNHRSEVVCHGEGNKNTQNSERWVKAKIWVGRADK